MDVNYSLVPPKDVTLPNFMKTFMNSHKTSKFTSRKCPLYGIGYKKFGEGGEGMRLPFWHACVFFVYMHAFLTCLLVARAISMMVKRSCNPFAN